MACASRLLGRTAELDRLDAAVKLLGAEAGAALLLSGEPGIGKTALLDWTARTAADRGHLVLEGRATELERDVPFGVFIDALDDYLASLHAHRLGDLGEGQRRCLAAVFPAFPGPDGGFAGLPQERYRVHRAVRALLTQLASRQPLVLVLDDLHWADPASVELLDHLLRHPPPSPTLLLLAHRTGAASSPLLAAVRGECEHIKVHPLARLDAEPLLETVPDADVRERVYLESGGNPFYLEQLARAAQRGTLDRPSRAAESARREAGLGDDEDPMAALPAAVTDALADELNGLSATSCLVLHSAAVAGEPFGPDLVADIAQLDRGLVLASLDETLSASLIRATDSPMWFRFRHPIVRRAVYASAGAAWRIGAHARAATVLARTGASPVARAHHLARCSANGDRDAVRVLSEAGHAVSALAPATASDWFGAALALLPDECGTDERLALMGPRAAALGAAGRLAEARAELAAVLGLLADDQSSVGARIICFIAVIDRLLGRHDDARGLLRRSLETLADPASREATDLQLELAADRYFAGDWSAMRDEGEKAWRLAAAGSDRGLKAASASVLGLGEYSVRRLSHARERLQEARTLVEDDRPDGTSTRLEAYDWLGWLELSMEEHAAAIGHFECGLELGRRTGGGHLLSTMTFGLVLGSVWSGRLTEAVEHSETTLELARLSGSERVMSWALGLRTLVDLRSGALEHAVASGEEAKRLEHSLAHNPFSAVNGGWLGEARIEIGDHARGRAEVLEALGGAELPGVESAFRPYFYDVLTGAEIATGRVEEAAGWARLARSAAEGLDLPGRTGAGLHAEALVALAAGDADRAVSAACESARLLAIAHPIESARARILAGRSLAAAGERERAVTELRRSARESTALGARRHAALAVRELRRLGERIGRGGCRGEAVSGLPSLSGREREVVELVTARLTNREIAARLVLSEKTVERHLTRIFAKLDARSRVEVARIAESSLRT